MDLSLKSEQFKSELLEYINNTQLPPVVLYYIMKDLMTMIENGYKTYLDNVSKTAEEDSMAQQEQNIETMNNFTSADTSNNSEI